MLDYARREREKGATGSDEYAREASKPQVRCLFSLAKRRGISTETITSSNVEHLHSQTCISLNESIFERRVSLNIHQQSQNYNPKGSEIFCLIRYGVSVGMIVEHACMRIRYWSSEHLCPSQSMPSRWHNCWFIMSRNITTGVEHQALREYNMRATVVFERGDPVLIPCDNYSVQIARD